MEKIKSLLADLIQIDSSTISGANQAIAYCERWLTEKGFKVQKITNDGYDMIICEIGKGEKTFIWNGHVDVVSGKDGQFTPYERDGKLYGRGSADMKAGVSALMCALVGLKDKDLGCKVQLQLVPDEETGGRHGSSYLVEQGYRGDFVICPEPTQLGIGLQAKGVLQLDLTIHGVSAHGSRPWEGQNAISKAYEVYQCILGLPFATASSEFFQAPSINLSRIQGGEVYNKVPDCCVISLDIRFLPTQSQEEIIQQIKNVMDGELDIHLSGAAVKNEEDEPHIKDVMFAIKKITGTESVDIFGQHGFADTRYFARYGIPAIEFGPCGENWHGDEEFVVLESVERYQRILVEWILMQDQKFKKLH